MESISGGTSILLDYQYLDDVSEFLKTDFTGYDEPIVGLSVLRDHLGELSYGDFPHGTALATEVWERIFCSRRVDNSDQVLNLAVNVCATYMDLMTKAALLDINDYIAHQAFILIFQDIEKIGVNMNFIIYIFRVANMLRKVMAVKEVGEFTQKVLSALTRADIKLSLAADVMHEVKLKVRDALDLFEDGEFSDPELVYQLKTKPHEYMEMTSHSSLMQNLGY